MSFGLRKVLLLGLCVFQWVKIESRISNSFNSNDPYSTFWSSKWAPTPSEDLELLRSQEIPGTLHELKF